MNTCEITKTITFTPAYDRRDPDPAKDYGIHSVEMCWVYRGPLGATQFLVFTGWHLPHIETPEFARPLPVDLGYHSPTPRYEGQSEFECDLLPGGKCYYEGSGLNAYPVFQRLVAEGGDAVWEELAQYYRELFEEDSDAR